LSRKYTENCTAEEKLSNGVQDVACQTTIDVSSQAEGQSSFLFTAMHILNDDSQAV